MIITFCRGFSLIKSCSLLRFTILIFQKVLPSLPLPSKKELPTLWMRGPISYSEARAQRLAPGQGSILGEPARPRPSPS